MHSRSTIILVAVALAMFGYIVLFEAPGSDKGVSGVADRRVFPGLQPDEVTVVTLVRSNQTVRLERMEGGVRWRLSDPEYPAQGWLVEGLLGSLAELRSSTSLGPSDLNAEEGGMASLGLEPPRISLVIEQGGERFDFAIGDRTLLGKTMYLQVAGSDSVEVVGAGPLERLPAGTAAWRDPRFLFLDDLVYDRLQMRSPSREYVLRRDGAGGRWRLSEPRPARADHARVEQLLQQLQAMQIGAFAAEQGVTDMEPFGLANPEAVFTFAKGTNPVLTVDFGHSPTNAPELVFARRSFPAGLVLVPKDVLGIVAVPYTDLLDYRLIDRSLDQLGSIRITGQEQIELERGTNGVWELRGEELMPTDPGLVGVFLEQLGKLRVLDVAKEVVSDLDLATYGLAEPRSSLTLRWPAEEGETNVTELRLDFGGLADQRVYVRRSDEVPVYTLAQEDFVALPRAAFELRDRRLWNFTTNDVVGVSLMVGGATNRLIRSSGGQWSIAPGSQGMVNTFAMEEAMHRMGALRARFWVAQGIEHLPDYGIPQRDHRLAIDVRQAGEVKTLRLAFGASSPSGGPFAATMLDGEPTVFECPLDVFYPYDEAVRSMMPVGNSGR